MSVRENLIAAKALIADPSRWAAADRDRVVNGGSCLCALDAVAEIVGNDWDHDGADERTALHLSIPSEFRISTQSLLHPVAQFNDCISTTHQDMMFLFDRAIEASE